MRRDGKPVGEAGWGVVGAQTAGLTNVPTICMAPVSAPTWAGGRIDARKTCASMPPAVSVASAADSGLACAGEARAIGSHWRWERRTGRKLLKAPIAPKVDVKSPARSPYCSPAGGAAGAAAMVAALTPISGVQLPQ